MILFAPEDRFFFFFAVVRQHLQVSVQYVDVLCVGESQRRDRDIVSVHACLMLFADDGTMQTLSEAR